MSDYEVTVKLTEEQARSYLDAFRSNGPWSPVHRALADAIRANPPKPPRAEEPKGFEKVIAHILNAEPRVYVRFAVNGECRWTDGYNNWRWAELIDPDPVDGGAS